MFSGRRKTWQQLEVHCELCRSRYPNRKSDLAACKVLRSGPRSDRPEIFINCLGHDLFYKYAKDVVLKLFRHLPRAGSNNYRLRPSIALKIFLLKCLVMTRFAPFFACASLHNYRAFAFRPAGTMITDNRDNDGRTTTAGGPK